MGINFPSWGKVHEFRYLCITGEDIARTALFNVFHKNFQNRSEKLDFHSYLFEFLSKISLVGDARTDAFDG